MANRPSWSASSRGMNVRRRSDEFNHFGWLYSTWTTLFTLFTAHSKNRPLDGKWHVYPEMAAAGLWTTPSDLARAGIQLQLALKGDSNCVLSRETATAMLTPGIEKEIGIGFFLSGTGRNVRFGYDGRDEGFVAEMTMYKETGNGAVIMINSNEGSAMLYEIERAIAREYDWLGYFDEEKKAVALSDETMGRFVGIYTNRAGLEYSVIHENDHLLFRPPGQPPIEVYPKSGTNFFMKILNAEIAFDVTKDGHVNGLKLQQEGRSFSAERKP